MFHHQKFPKNAFCKNALLNSTSFSPLSYWQKLLDMAEQLSASKQSKKRPRKYKLKAEVSITPLLAALLAACSDTTYVPIGGTLDGTNVTTPTGEIPALPFYLYVLDGAVEGALVYVDENANGQRDTGEDSIGTTDENGRVFIEAEYAGETFFIDASGAFDLFTGARLPSDTFYRAISEDRGGSDVVASPISTIVQALRESDETLTDTQILELIFGANTQIDMDDLNNPNNYILPVDGGDKPIASPAARAEEIASTSIRLQVLIEEKGGDLAAVLVEVRDNNGFDVTDDLNQTSQDTANARIIEARERANGEPVANPVTGTTAILNNDLALEMDVWGFRDPVGNRNVNILSSFTELNIVSITDGITTDVRGVLVHIADDDIETEYGAGGEIPFEHLGNLFFRPVADYLGRVEIIYTVFDGEDDSDEASLEIEVISDPNAPVFLSSATASVNENIAANDEGDTQGSAMTVYEARAESASGGNVTYSLAGTDAALFGIDAEGDIWLRSPPDHENKSSYSFTVVASVTADGETHSASQIITLSVTDLNDNAPVFTSSATASVNENIAANDEGDTQGSAATIYTAIAAPDDAGDTVSYSLTSANDGDSFGINASTGDVWFLRSPDYEDEDEREYTFTVVASVTADGVTQTASQIITLSVTDLNDNAPTVSLGDTDDLVVNEAGFVYVGFNLFLNIKFTPKPGINPSGINFTHTFDANSNVANGTFIIKMDSQYDEVEIFDNSDSPSYTYDHIINQFNVAQQDETRYMTALLFAEDGHIAYPLSRILFFGRDRSGFYGAPRDDIPADLAANGVLTFGDAETSLTNLSVFIGNTDATIANITEEIEAGTPRTIAGMGVSDAIADGVYGSFTFTRATDGSVTWNYTLNEDAVNALGDGQTATDSVWVRVNDGNLDSEIQEIKVLITGANDAPTLTSAGTVQPIAENIATQTDTGVTLTPADVDVNTTFDADSFTVYEVTNGTADTDISSRFRVVAGDDADNDNDYKLVLLAGQLTDYEIEPTITLNVNVTDGVNVSDTVEVTVTLTDELESPPVFSSAEAAAVDENIEANNNASVQGTATEVYTAEITANLTYDTITYSLLDSDEGNDFGIDGTSGNVWFKFSPDYEDEDEREYTFTVQAVVTAGGVTQAAERTVTLSVNNLNDNRPVFTSSATASVNENIAANNNATDQGSAATIYTAIAAPDVPGHTVSYSLAAANDGASFGIDGTSGNVWFREPPDYEDITEREYKFTVVASVTADGVTQIGVRNITLSVTDLNDNPPAFTSNTTASVNENVAANDDGDTQGSAMMVYRATTILDVAGHTVSYSINTSAPIYQSASFGIDSSSGIVWLLESPDHETQSSYLFTLVASVTADGVTQTATSNRITLSINDLNDNAPVFTSSSRVSVNENIAANNNASVQGTATEVYRAAARPDVPGHTVSYSLTSFNQGDLFGIDSSIGIVWLRASPDYETRSSYSFTVVASVTADGVTQTATRFVTLSINDLDENPPTVNTAHADYDVTDTYETGDIEAASGRWVVEDAGGTALSYDVQAQGTYGTLRFGTDGNWGYAIDTTNSDIQNLNAPTTLTDTITVRATDEDGEFVDGTVTVTITDATNTLYVNGTSGDDGSLGDAAATDQQIVQGGDGTDFLRGGTADDILIGGAGNDTISLNHGGNDTVIYRIASTDDGLFGLDGADTITSWRFSPETIEDKVVFVDTDDTPLGSFADLLELGKGTDAQLEVNFADVITNSSGALFVGELIFTFLGDTTDDSDDVKLILDFGSSFALNSIAPRGASDAVSVVVDVDDDYRLTDAGLTSLATNLADNFETLSEYALGIDIISDVGENPPTVNTAHADYDVTDTYESGDLEAASGRWVVEDADEGDTLSYDVQAQGTYGTLRFGTDGNWGYAIDTTHSAILNLNTATTLVDTITVRATDEAGEFVDGTVTVIINDAINTLYMNGTSDDDGTLTDPLGSNTATVPQILQGGDGNDFLRGWIPNDIFIGGAGNDTILLAPGRNDTVIYRIASTDDGLFGLDGNDTVINFRFDHPFEEDNVVFVNTDDTPLGSFADLLELGKRKDADGNDLTPQLEVNLDDVFFNIIGEPYYGELIFTFLGDTTTPDDDATLTFEFGGRFALNTIVPRGDLDAVSVVVDVDDDHRLTDAGLTILADNLADDFDVVALEEFGIEII